MRWCLIMILIGLSGESEFGGQVNQCFFLSKDFVWDDWLGI